MRSQTRNLLLTAAAFTLFTAAALSASQLTQAAEPMKALTGDQEVPPVKTVATATSEILISSDLSVSGVVKTAEIDGTAAHIHMGAIGTNGPVVVALVKTTGNIWSVPDGTRLTPAQYDSYKAGHLYVNVHSAAHPAGELRLQLAP